MQPSLLLQPPRRWKVCATAPDPSNKNPAHKESFIVPIAYGTRVKGRDEAQSVKSRQWPCAGPLFIGTDGEQVGLHANCCMLQRGHSRNQLLNDSPSDKASSANCAWSGLAGRQKPKSWRLRRSMEIKLSI